MQEPLARRFLLNIVRSFLICIVLDLLLSPLYYSVRSQSDFFNASALSVPLFERQEINDVESGGWIFWPSNDEDVKIASKDGAQLLSQPPITNQNVFTINQFLLKLVQ